MKLHCARGFLLLDFLTGLIVLMPLLLGLVFLTSKLTKDIAKQDVRFDLLEVKSLLSALRKDAQKASEITLLDEKNLEFFDVVGTQLASYKIEAKNDFYKIQREEKSKQKTWEFKVFFKTCAPTFSQDEKKLLSAIYLPSGALGEWHLIRDFKQERMELEICKELEETEVLQS